MLTTEDVLEQLGLDEQGDYDADEPMMPGSDDQFSDLEKDVYLEDIEDDDDNDDDNRVHYSSLHPTPGSFSDPSSPNGATGSTPPPSGAASSAPSPSDAPGSSSDTLPCWSSTPTPFTIPPFRSPVGPKVDIPESPGETFELLFTPAFLDNIVEQSNEYAKEVMGEERYSSWEKITTEELKACLGVCILMGINHLPALEDYWSKDPTYHYSPIADRITSDRYRDISRYLHFVDNSRL